MDEDKVWAPLYRELAEIVKECQNARWHLRDRNFEGYAQSMTAIARLATECRDKTEIARTEDRFKALPG
jgi:hypothetical protein